VHSHLVFAAGDLRGISSSFQDCLKNDRIACDAGLRGNNELVSDGNLRIIGKALIDCNRSLSGKLQKQSDKRQEHD
jgi:hypothetical protein